MLPERWQRSFEREVWTLSAVKKSAWLSQLTHTILNMRRAKVES